jgi:class 3 adenylate cyclase/tetratricopeptide (TPR) repeat protein
MKCSRCQHENPAGSNFCLECGAHLGLTCATCGTGLPAGSKFCNNCGTPLASGVEARFASPDAYTPKHLAERILTSKAALEGERKQVTVLFADLRGSMEVLADRDPEEARKILDPVLAHMMDAVHRYEGTVNQVMGDGIMALFGAPLAHEDHAVRACYAALRMQESVNRYAEAARRTHGVNVQIRVGLNSGEVVVRAIGSDLRMDYTAVGQTTHLAARMEQLASPGTTLVTPSTFDLVEGFVAVKAIGPVPVKGLVDPVEVYEVTGAGPARTRLQATARRGLTRFVGRDAELDQLRRAQQFAASGRGQVAAIVGEAGVGKSRLVHEFVHSHRLQGWLILAAASVSYGKATSYLPVVDLLRGYFKIHDRDDLREIREKVTGKLFALDRALESTLPAFLALLDVPVDDATWPLLGAGERRQRTLDAVKRLLLREAREQPVLVIFEDLHWIDGETQAVLDALVENLGSTRLLLLVNYRPEYRHGWSGKTYYGQLRLDALPAESAAELLAALLGNDPGLGPLKQLLVKRGNPFFLEETVRTLVETKALVGEQGRYRLTQPIQAIQVPSTVQTILAARIDRLSPDDKRLLQTASVVGKDVQFALLQAIAEMPEDALRAGLDRLQSAEFIHETGLYPDLEYSFKHALTHEVTYGGLLHDRRRHLHARIVSAIETLHKGRLAEHVERLAHHALRAELGETAVRYLRQAGLKAAARSALPEARTWFEQALGVLDSVADSPSMLEERFDIRLELRTVLTLLGESRRALALLREAAAVAGRLNDDAKRARVFVQLTSVHANLGELDEALAAGNRALAIARHLADPRLRVPATSYLAQAHYLRGDYERAVQLTAENLAALPPELAYEHLGLATPASIYDRVYLALGLTRLGRFTDASETAAEAIRLAEPTHHAFAIGMAHHSLGFVHLARGDWVTAVPCFDRAIPVSRSGNVLITLVIQLALCAAALAYLGRTAEASDRIAECEPLAERLAAMGVSLNIGVSYHWLGRASLLLGRLDEARRLGDRAMGLNQSQLGSMVDMHHLLGDIAAHADRLDADRAAAHYRQALALAQPRGMRPLIAHCHLGLGKLHWRTGKREQSLEHVTTAARMYREMEMTFWLGQADVARTALA